MQGNNIRISLPTLKIIEDILLKRFTQATKEIPSDLKEFVKEISTLEKEKYYTQVRATKISVSLTLFYSINEFKQEKNIEELQSQLQAQIKGKIAKVFAQSAQNILTLLHSYPKRTFQDAELYFVDEKALKEIAKIEKFLISNFDNKSDVRSYGIQKLVNPILKNEVCFKYSVFYTPKFKHITKKLSVEKYQSGDFVIWKNSLIKNHHEIIELHKPDDMTIKRMQLALEAKLLAAKDEHEYMQKNRDNLDIRIIHYEDAELRPVIKYTTAKHTNDKHLRNQVPNVLWLEFAPFRKDMDADEFILNAQNAYGNVYYI